MGRRVKTPWIAVAAAKVQGCEGGEEWAMAVLAVRVSARVRLKGKDGAKEATIVVVAAEMALGTWRQTELGSLE